MAEHVDVLVVGAGLSGIAAGYYLQTECPNRSYVILEMRADLGGTWDLFRYPGIRCDSDMYSLGYPFRPWPREEMIADGPDILAYLRDTAREYGIDERIRFRHKLVSAAWSSERACWTAVAERTDTGERVEITAGFLLGCTGYYDYERGYTPDYPGRERYRGTFVHPQFWPEDLDYDDKRVVVIGSGATAVTLIPAMAQRARSITMLQRSPSYILSVPRRDPITRKLRELPEPWGTSLVRWKNTLRFLAFYVYCRQFPERARRDLMAGVRGALNDDFDVETHFGPQYQPWDQRLCLVPDSDLFETIKSGKADVVTDQIDTFTERGIRLASGRELEADVVVSATGLVLKVLGGIRLEVDGEVIDPADRFVYRGALLHGVPNFAFVVGYTNASWTLKVVTVEKFVCRLLRHMDERGFDTVVAALDDPGMERQPLLDMTSGYIQRARHLLPSNGSRRPWKLYQNFLVDRFMLGRARFDDGVLRFSSRRRAKTSRLRRGLRLVASVARGR